MSDPAIFIRDLITKDDDLEEFSHQIAKAIAEERYDMKHYENIYVFTYMNNWFKSMCCLMVEVGYLDKVSVDASHNYHRMDIEIHPTQKLMDYVEFYRL